MDSCRPLLHGDLTVKTTRDALLGSLLAPPRPWLTGPSAAADGPARLRGSLGRCLPPDPRQTDRVADSGEGTGERVSVSGHRWCDKQTRRAEGLRERGDRRQPPISRPCGSRDERMAGVWGEASPQAPPEARWTVGRSRGASQPWAGGARRRNRLGSHGPCTVYSGSIVLWRA